jgi:hypothetical protein
MTEKQRKNAEMRAFAQWCNVRLGYSRKAVEFQTRERERAVQFNNRKRIKWTDGA